MRTGAVCLLFCMLLSGVTLSWAAHRRLARGRAAGPRPGTPLPDFAVSRWEGEAVSLRRVMRSRKSLVLFIKPECRRCQSQLSTLDHLAAMARRGIPLVIVADGGGAAEAELRAFAARFGSYGEVYFDRSGARRALGISAVPCLLVVDEAGVTRLLLKGERDAEFLARSLAPFFDLRAGE